MPQPDKVADEEYPSSTKVPHRDSMSQTQSYRSHFHSKDQPTARSTQLPPGHDKSGVELEIVWESCPWDYTGAADAHRGMSNTKGQVQDRRNRSNGEPAKDKGGNGLPSRGRDVGESNELTEVEENSAPPKPLSGDGLSHDVQSDRSFNANENKPKPVPLPLTSRRSALASSCTKPSVISINQHHDHAATGHADPDQICGRIHVSPLPSKDCLDKSQIAQTRTPGPSHPLTTNDSPEPPSDSMQGHQHQLRRLADIFMSLDPSILAEFVKHILQNQASPAAGSQPTNHATPPTPSTSKPYHVDEKVEDLLSLQGPPKGVAHVLGRATEIRKLISRDLESRKLTNSANFGSSSEGEDNEADFEPERKSTTGALRRSSRILKSSTLNNNTEDERDSFREADDGKDDTSSPPRHKLLRSPKRTMVSEDEQEYSESDDEQETRIFQRRGRSSSRWQLRSMKDDASSSLQRKSAKPLRRAVPSEDEYNDDDVSESDEEGEARIHQKQGRSSRFSSRKRQRVAAPPHASATRLRSASHTGKHRHHAENTPPPHAKRRK
ncbi:hypothetical protein ONZ45_g6350 [Pleurotus djamor]|nr:hypothetical protein ONZ45_g6350 [Pleurotus djamor]